MKDAPCPIVDKGQEVYGFDHTLIGLTLLEARNIGSQISRAALNHHSEISAEAENDLAALLTVADFLCFKAGPGFSLNRQLRRRNCLFGAIAWSRKNARH